MPIPQQQWILAQTEQPPEWFVQAVKQYAPASWGNFAAQLLWQRGIQDEATLAAFVSPQAYQSASPFEFGQEMDLAVRRLQKAWENKERVAIWGDFDADGITSTAVLWDGLGQFFTQNEQLIYYIPNRLTESHGLNCKGIENIAKQSFPLIVTCDTGSTNIEEITYAKQLGIDIIVTDHHTLPAERPSVTAIINPRYLPNTHPLFNLSGVAVAYKLVEALYQTLPSVPQTSSLEDLLDLVAVGLIADLVQLSGDCRYLAQLGIQRLQEDFKKTPEMRRRPGVGRLLELCQKNGDRPTDISFGLGPRINAVSRIQGDTSFCVELLTSRDQKRVSELAEMTELANARRKSLQKDVTQQVEQKLARMDLSTTSVIVLEDPQWAVGVLGLVAGQVAQETGRPTILLSTEGLEIGDKELSNENSQSPIPNPQSLARGSARSINSIDLYQLVKEQAHLLHRFGGHPYAAGLSLPVENIPLFTEAINQQLRRSLAGTNLIPTLQADIAVTVADLGKELFLELKLLEPCGMGNPVPKLLIQNCWFENAWHRNQQDSRGKKVQYIKAEFDIRDDSTKNPFPGVWWGHYKDELPLGRCDCIVELDYNTFKKRYEIRIVAVRSLQESAFSQRGARILDWRNTSPSPPPPPSSPLLIEKCPTSWDDLRAWLKRSLYEGQPLALAWSKPKHKPPEQIWLTLVGLAKYLSRTHYPVTRIQLLDKVGVGDHALLLGLRGLKYLGFRITRQDRALIFTQHSNIESTLAETAIAQFLVAVREEQFQQQYFVDVPLSTIEAIANSS
ncbi:single-stranded-DNA-specific exonuclease RecJ [Scytonema sp. NUACC26]|uniref:single-stranded-DNA-specific exonuclease RecJ n=1 Tax=Scytonema sp. NUACC26 TaxID=3140176 RepID=UPI0034DBFD21